MAPKDIPLGIYTHINFAFALLNPKTFRLDDMDAGTASLYGDVAALKLRQPDLEVWIGEDESFADDRANDRGGIPEDFDNYVNLLRRLRQRLNASGRKYGISLAVPASYWYLRGFNLQEMEQYVSWFNIMTYDIHGVWDKTIDVSLSIDWIQIRN
ncbi:hypothetical protein CGMCC3_g7462 [Colletotrichum fructicola]|nr:uncharacterized protein CGMCC3_g7462 [Colletotrichum fructicola]KAE9576581.1 hypothetical protein CGMCC3_g7462 [Colletotrichum fructicola]